MGIEICPKESVEWELPKIEYFLVLGNGIEFDFGAYEWSGTTMGIQPKINPFLNVNIPPRQAYYIPLAYRQKSLLSTTIL